MTKKRIRKILAVSILVSLFHTGEIKAEEEPDYSDSSYWTAKCSSSEIQSAGDYAACEAYREYMASQSDDLAKQLEEVEKERQEIADHLSEYAGQPEEYQKEADALIPEIEALDQSIIENEAAVAEMQEQIEAKQTEIDEKQQKTDEIMLKIRDRMVSGQRTMRTNTMIDILMGAKSLNDFIRILNGVSAITQYDNATNEEIFQLMDELSADKEELIAAQQELETRSQELVNQRKELEQKQETALVNKYKSQVIIEEYEKQAAELEANYEATAAEIEEVQSSMNGISDELDNVPDTVLNPPTPEPTPTPTPEPTPTSEPTETPADPDNPAETEKPETTADPEGTADPAASPEPTEAPAETPNPLTTTGWTYPVPGAVRSAGTWYYNSGGVHLGYDFAISPGSAIYAAGNGVILRSADACPTYGGLGSGCGYPGSYGGGNQVYLLTKINGSLYAVKYLHMMSGSPIAQGTIVTAGTQIGKVGSSGNSSGPHCHIEIFWLGSADNFSNYAKTWNLDLAFGCGWGYSALSRLCENGVGAPCRIRPETIFGY